MTSSHEGALPQGFPYTRGTVEDSHDASIAEDIRSAARGLEHIAARLEAREAEIAKVREEILCHAAGIDPEKCSAFQEHTRRICLEWAARLGGAT